MSSIVRGIRRADQLLLSQVFQPLVDHFVRLETARYRLAYMCLVLWAFGWLVFAAFHFQRLGYFNTVMLALLGAVEVSSTATAIRHESFTRSLGLDGLEPNHVFYLRYRIAYLVAGLVLASLALFDVVSVIASMIASFAFMHVAGLYFLSSEDPRPGRRGPSSPITAPPGPAPQGHRVRVPIEPADVS